MTDIEFSDERIVAFELIHKTKAGLVTFEDGLQRIIDTEAWRTAGYSDMLTMFDAEGFGDLKLGAAIRRRLVEQFSYENPDLIQEDIADVLGVSQPTISRDMKIIASHSREYGIGTDTPKSDIDEIEDIIPDPVDPFIPAQSGILPISEPVDPYAGWNFQELEDKKNLDLGFAVVVDLHVGDIRKPHLTAWAAENDLLVNVSRKVSKYKENPFSKLKWGNPFIEGQDGTLLEVVLKYEEHYLPYKNQLQDNLVNLQGKVLGCWCDSDTCHGSIIKEEVSKTVTSKTINSSWTENN